MVKAYSKKRCKVSAFSFLLSAKGFIIKLGPQKHLDYAIPEIWKDKLERK